MEAKVPTADAPPALRDMLRQLPPPDWVREMIEHHRRTGTYRPEDLERLLGDPNKRVEVRSEVSLTSFLSDLQGRSS